MALKSNNTAVAIVIQSAAGTFDAAGSSDIMPVSQLTMNIQGVNIDNDEYTGSVVKNAPFVVGKRVTISYRVKLRPPGAALPAANAFLPGRILQAAKFTEVRNTSAIPASAEALGVGSTTTAAVLGAGAAGTANLYRGYPLILSDKGTNYPDRLTAIVGYAADKTATLAETYGAAPAANYQIPIFLAYQRSNSSDDPIILSHEVHIDGHRFDLMDCRLQSLSIVVPTSTKEAAAFPELEATFDATIYQAAEEATPAVTPLGMPAFFKDGDMWLNRKQIGTRSFTIDLGIQSELPPNPNKDDGNDLAEIISTTASVTMEKQKYLPSAQNILALADAQASHPLWAQWGRAVGGMVGITIPEARVGYFSPNLGGGVVMESGDLMIDAVSRSVCIYFPCSS